MQSDWSSLFKSSESPRICENKTADSFVYSEDGLKSVRALDKMGYEIIFHFSVKIHHVPLLELSQGGENILCDLLPLKRHTKIAAGNTHFFISVFFLFFLRKIRLEVSCESSA